MTAQDLIPNTPKRGFFSRIVRKFDAWEAKVPEQEVPRSGVVDWVGAIPFIGMHLTCLFVFVVGFSWVALATALVAYAVRMFGITAFYHRYFSHRTFKTSRPFQYIGALLGAISVQRGPLWWAAHHRLHHRHSDDEKDVHSPKQYGFLWSHMGWILDRVNVRTRKEMIPDFMKFPELRFLDRFDLVAPIGFAVGMFLFGVALEAFAPGLGTNGWQMLVWGFFVSTVFLYHGTFTINSLAHVFGSRRFETKDTSRNNFWLALITLGEGWHNNHHHCPATVRQGFRWYEIDVSYYVLKGLSFFGIVWDLRPIPSRIRKQMKGS